MATGLLVVGVGPATRLLRFVQGGVKEYVATARLGVATDSLDADGAVLTREPMPVSPEDVAAVLPRFIGTIHQVPPMVSARKVAGRRLYELAREGVEVEREARPVTIHELEVLDFAPSDYPELTFRVRCSSGTYVRSLADDIAAALGGRAHLTALRRVSNGALRVEEARSIAELESLAETGRFAEAVMPPAAGLADLAAISVDENTGAAVRNGAILHRGSVPGATGPFRVLDARGDLLAVYRAEGGSVRPEVVLP